MRISPRLWFWITFAAIMVVMLLWPHIIPRRHTQTPAPNAIPDLSVTSPLNQPGGNAAPTDAYEVYSALYQAPTPEPLAFADYSSTDIPQANGSCLKPSTPQEQQMADAFVAANVQSHPWEQKFVIPDGYELLPPGEVTGAESCIETHGQQGRHCDRYKQLRHVRFLGVPGFDRTHTHALVSVIKKCGRYCGSGGIFVAENTGGTWRRADTTYFTRNCSWMY